MWRRWGLFKKATAGKAPFVTTRHVPEQADPAPEKSDVGEGDSDVPDKDGWTPLHWSAYWRQFDRVRELVRSGADVNRATHNGWCALHWVASQGGTEADEAMALLLAKHANCNTKNNHGATPLHLAAWAGASSCVSMLVKAGADATVVDDVGRTPLHRAVVCGWLDVSKELLDISDIDKPDGEGCTPLHLACSNNHAHVVKLLLERQADTLALNAHGQTPKDVADSAGHKAIAMMLDEATRWDSDVGEVSITVRIPAPEFPDPPGFLGGTFVRTSLKLSETANSAEDEWCIGNAGRYSEYQLLERFQRGLVPADWKKVLELSGITEEGELRDPEMANMIVDIIRLYTNSVKAEAGGDALLPPTAQVIHQDMAPTAQVIHQDMAPTAQDLDDHVPLSTSLGAKFPWERPKSSKKYPWEGYRPQSIDDGCNEKKTM